MKNKGIDRWIYRYIVGWIDGWIYRYIVGWIDGWIYGWIDGWMDRWMDLLYRCIDRQMIRQIDDQIDR